MTILSTFPCSVPFRPPRRRIRAVPEKPQPSPVQHVPRIARLMALALHLEGLVREGKVKNYAELGRLGHVDRSRITQIMNLLGLAPDIQEQLLFLPALDRGRDPIHLKRLQRIALVLDWTRQRPLWGALLQENTHLQVLRKSPENRVNCLEARAPTR
jgi:hypothetical protein